MSKDFNLNIQGLNRTEAAASLSIEGASDNLQCKKAIDLGGLDNLKQLQERYPEKFASTVYNEQGVPVSREELEKLNEQAGKIGVDKVGSSNIADDKEENEAISNLYNLKSLKKLSPEQFEEITHNKDGELKSKEELEKIDQDINTQLAETIEKSKEDGLVDKVLEASEKYKETKEKIIEERRRIAELNSEEFDEEKATKEIEEGFKKDSELGALVTGEEDIDPANLDAEKVKNILSKLEYHNKAVDDKEQIDKEMSSDDIFKNSFLFKGSKLEESLEEIQEGKEQIEKSKAAAEKAGAGKEVKADPKVKQAGNNQNADPEDPANGPDSLEKYRQAKSSDSKSGLYVDNSGIIKREYEKFVKNDKVVDINNDKYFNKKHDTAMKQVLESKGELNFEDKNDPLNLLLADENGKGKSIKDTQEQLKELESGKGNSASNSPADFLGASSEKGKFDPYKKSDEGMNGIAASITDAASDDSIVSGTTAELQFKTSAGDTSGLEDTKGQIENQIQNDGDVMQGQIDAEQNNLDMMTADADTRTKISEQFNQTSENNQAAYQNAGVFSQALIDEENAMKQIAEIQNRNTTQMQNYAQERHNEGSGLETAGAGLKAIGAALQCNPATASAGAAMIAAGEALCAAGKAQHQEGDRGSANADYQKQLEAEAKRKEADIAAVKTNLQQKQMPAAKATGEVLKAMGDGFSKITGDLVGNMLGQQNLVSGLQTKKDDRMAKLEQDKNNIDAKIAQKKDKSNETEKAGKSEETKETKSNDTVFELKENAENQQAIKSSLLGENPLKEDAKTASPANIDAGNDKKANTVETLTGGKTQQIGDKKDESSEEGGAETIQFQAFSNENKLDKNEVEKEDGLLQGVKPAATAQKPALRMASRINKINNAENGAGKTLTA